MRPWPRRRRARLAAAGLLGVLGIGTASDPPAQAAVPTAPFPTPLATSMVSPDGTWATLPMGHLDNRRDTFWQLFFQSAGGTQWSNQVEATATATNGGLVLADGAHQLAVGIRPSQDLRFTPIITTADAGTSWNNGLLSDQAVASRPNALAVNGEGRALAVVEGRQGDEVMTTTESLSSWRTLLTERTLADTDAGRKCAPGAITAVAYLSGEPLVGTSCARAGAAGLFRLRSGEWQPAGPSSSSTLAKGRTEVLGADPSTSGLEVLLGISGSTGDYLVAAWTTGAATWSTSPALRVPSGDRLASYGPTGGNGQFVLLRALSGAEQLEVLEGPPDAWHQLPPPPSTTATVADGQGDVIDALAVHDTVLTVWTLGPSDRWASSQVVRVPIQFGSSNP